MQETRSSARLRGGVRNDAARTAAHDGFGGFGVNTPEAVPTEIHRAARVAHDIQTPVAIILGLCSRIETAELDAEQAEDLGRIRAQAAAIGLAAEALVKSHAPPRPRALPVDASRAVREVACDLAVLARARGVVVRTDADHAAYVRDDHGQLRPAIMNLLTNALRQLGEGGRVSCTVTTSRGIVTIEIADSGPGVPASERASVLRPYEQGAGRRGHAGLGLSIVSEAAVGLGGTLSIGESAEGGAAFALALPLARHPRPRRRSAQRA